MNPDSVFQVGRQFSKVREADCPDNLFSPSGVRREAGMTSQSIDYDTLVSDDRVHGRVYLDPEIFEDEIARIFHRGWVYVGHTGGDSGAG